MAAANDKYDQIEVLLKLGADQDISDHFLNIHHVARKLNMHHTDGKYSILFNVIPLCIK